MLEYLGWQEAAEAIDVHQAGPIGPEWWPVLVAAAVALTLCEGISYHRRWTV